MPHSVPDPPSRPPGGLLPTLLGSWGSAQPLLASLEPGQTVWGGGRLACISAPLPLHTPPPALFQPQASSGSCTRLPQPLALRGPRPQGRRVERKCCRKCCSWGSPRGWEGGRGVSVTPILGPGQMEATQLPRARSPHPGPQEEPAPTPALQVPSFPSIPSSRGQSLYRYFLSTYSALEIV